jgi:hypothetical protein
MKYIKHILVGLLLAPLMLLAACEPAANVASRNVSIAADNFEVNRRITFFAVVPMKGVEYLAVIEGKCSLGNNDSAGELTVTCKDGEGQFSKYFLGFDASTISYMVQQGKTAAASDRHSRVILRPETLVPSVEFD